MRRAIWLVVALLGTAGGCGTAPEVYGTVGDFSLVDQAGRTVTRSSLLGKVWVASFVFTRCTTLCPQVAGTMARLQEQTAGRDDVVLVSFSVDPTHDTTAVLKDYGERFHADPARWLLLTGKRDAVYGLIRQSFHLGVEENRGEARNSGNEVTHSGKLAVVDRAGRIRGYFDGRQVDEEGHPVDELPRLRSLLEELVRERP